MPSRIHKVVTVLLTAVFAVFSCGNVVVHRLAAWHSCGCFEHATAAKVDAATCDCKNHGTFDEMPSNDGPLIAGHSDCPISHYFQQAVQSSTHGDLVRLNQACDFCSLSESAPVESALLLAFWSRGPPMSR